MLPLTALGLRRWGLAGVQSWLSRLTDLTGKAAADADEHAAAVRIAWTVQVAAAYGPWPANCLQRSVTLWWFLRRRGIVADIRIGVRRASDGALDFHAWVEHHGEVINDRRDLRRQYATFDRPIAPRHASFN